MDRGSTPEAELIHRLNTITVREKQIVYNAQCSDNQLCLRGEPLGAFDNKCMRCRLSYDEEDTPKLDTNSVDFTSNASGKCNYPLSKESYRWYKERLKNNQISLSSIYEKSRGHTPPKVCEPPFRRKTNELFSLISQMTHPPRFVFVILQFQLLLVLLLLLSVHSCWGEFNEDQLSNFRRERAEAAEKWAPLVFLHPDERYFPSDVHSFLHNVIPREISDSERTPEPPVIVSLSRSLDIFELPEGVASEDTYLIAPIDPKCKNCPLPNFLHGTKPSMEYAPPMYAIITSCLPTKEQYVRSPRNTDIPLKQLRRRRFRLKRRRRKLSFKDRLKLFRRRRTSLPSNNWDTYSDIKPLDSFTSLEEKYETLEGGESSKQIIKDYSLKKDVEEFTDIVVKPPSTTLLPPKERLATTLQPEPEDGVETTVQNDESILREIILDFNSTDTNSNEEVSYIIISQDKYLDKNLTTNNSISLDQDLDETIVPKEEKVKKTLAYLHENETQENDIQEGNIKINNSHRFTVTYWMFYPYSQGKQVCTSRLWILGRVFKPRLRNKCYGDLITLNSHVGDWEHVSIYFEDDLPQRMYVSTHTYGAYYNYEPNDNIFVYRGKDTRLGLPLNPKYPPIIKMDGTHPVLYAALGSHGLWGSPGVHRYENLVPLEDKTSAGTPWKSWHNIDIIDYRDPDHLRPDRQWLKFYGRWGNPSSGCHRALFGTCDLASGPTGIPLKRENFPCHLPDHPTFFPEI